MAVKFVIKKFHINGRSEYFQAETMTEDLFSSNVCLAWLFKSQKEAKNKISTMNGLFQIEKVFINVDTRTF